MCFWKSLKENMERIDTVYDLAAFCYDYMIKIIKNQTLFIGTYIGDNESAKNSNPNLRKLNKFSSVIELILRKQEKEGILFEKCKGKIDTKVRDAEESLEEYGEKRYNTATVPFFILLAIDRYVVEKRGHVFETGPLNKKYQKKTYVYLNIVHNILDDAMETNDFAHVIRKREIRIHLRHLIILEKRELITGIGVPKVVPLCIESNAERRRVAQSKKLKVAVIPFDAREMLSFPVEEGALFRVEYNERHIQEGSMRAVRLLEKAIQLKANIIIFPEFICHEKIQSALRQKLEELYENSPEKVGALFLVVAGSFWAKDDNNIGVIYSYTGAEIGRQYKFSSYCDWNSQMIEKLTKPGKETTFIDIDEIGRVAVRICRDISDRSCHVVQITKLFSPQILLVPAWSKSVNIGFRKQFSEITAENHRTCSVLCNCCEALKENNAFKKENGIIVTPYKNNTVVEGKEKMIQRKKDCDKEECFRGGCIFLVELNFEEEAVKNGKMVRIQRKFF